MNHDEFKALCKNGHFKEALALAVGDDAKSKHAPSRFAMDKKTGKPVFYRGNKRVEKDAQGEWQPTFGPLHGFDAQ